MRDAFKLKRCIKLQHLRFCDLQLEKGYATGSLLDFGMISFSIQHNNHVTFDCDN